MCSEMARELLELTIFGTLEKNSASVDFSGLLRDVITVVDEVDSQLKQTILGYMDVEAHKGMKGRHE